MDIILKYFPNLTDTQKARLLSSMIFIQTGTARSMSFRART